MLVYASMARQSIHLGRREGTCDFGEEIRVSAAGRCGWVVADRRFDGAFGDSCLAGRRSGSARAIGDLNFLRWLSLMGWRAADSRCDGIIGLASE